MTGLRAHPWNRFVALGDSITEGFGMDPVPGVEPIPWVERVGRELAAVKPDFEVHNLGWRNLTAAQVREWQLERGLALEPDLVSIAAGPNDLLSSQLRQERLERDLEPLYSEFAARGAFVFTFTFMNMPDSGLLPKEGAAWLKERMEILHHAIRTVANRHGALVIDFYGDPRSANPDFFSNDMKHANALGQKFVAEKTLLALEAALETRATYDSIVTRS